MAKTAAATKKAPAAATKKARAKTTGKDIIDIDSITEPQMVNLKLTWYSVVL